MGPAASLDTAVCSSEQLGSVPVLQHSKATIPFPCTFLGNQRDNSPARKPEAMSDVKEKFSVEHQKSFLSVERFQTH